MRYTDTSYLIQARKGEAGFGSRVDEKSFGRITKEQFLHNWYHDRPSTMATPASVRLPWRVLSRQTIVSP